MAMPEWKQARNLLCVRLDSLGDVLMTTPALRALRESVPERRLTLLTSPAGALAGALVPEVAETLTYDAPWMKSAAGPGGSRAEYEMADRLRARQFDGAVIFTVYSQSPLPAAFLCHLAGIPLRLAHCHENPYRLLTDWVRDPEPAALVRHEVQRQLDLVAAVAARTADPRLSLAVPAAAFATVDRLLDELGLDRGRPWAVIHPGATAASRRYPPTSYAEVARRLGADAGWQLVFSGGPEEAGLVETIRAAAGVPTHSLAGRLDLGELAALLSRAPVLIANNSGPVHVAAAVGTPVVDLYALTNPQHTPWAVPSRVLFHPVPCACCYRSSCPEGHHNCLRLVSPEEVVRAARELVEEAAAGGEPERQAACLPLPSAWAER